MLLLLAFACIMATAVSSSVQSAPGLPGVYPGRARVITIQDSRSIQTFVPVESRIAEMVNLGLVRLTEASSPAKAWQSLVATQDIVGIKVFSAPGPTSGTRLDVVAGVLQSMLSAGLKKEHILVWDKHASNLRRSGFFDLAERFGVHVEGAADAGYDENVFYESPLLGKPVWGDLEFGRSGPEIGRKSYVSKLLIRRISKIINVTPLLNHNLAGVSGNLYGLAFASVDNSIRFESTLERMATAIPELCALPELGDKVLLNIVDALICQYQGEERTLLHYSTILGQLRFSRDPVALDVLSLRELKRQRESAGILERPLNFQIYTNATVLDLGISDPRKIDLTLIQSEDANEPPVTRDE